MQRQAIENAKKQLLFALQPYSAKDPNKHTRQLTVQRIQLIDAAQCQSLEQFVRLIELEKMAVAKVSSSMWREKSELNKLLESFLANFELQNNNLSEKEELVVQLLKFIAETEMAPTYTIRSYNNIIKFAGNLAHQLFLAQNKTNFDTILSTFLESNYRNFVGCTAQLKSIVKKIRIYSQKEIQEIDLKKLNIENGSNLFNINCYDYLVNLVQFLPKSLCQQYSYCENLKSLLFNESDEKKSYDDRTQYNRIYASFMEALQKDIKKIAESASKNFDRDTINFINSIYNNENSVLERSGKFAKDVLRQAKTNVTSKQAANVIYQVSWKGGSFFEVSPAQQESSPIKFYSVFSRNFQPQLKTNLPSIRRYKFHQLLPWTELRFGTQEERIQEGYIGYTYTIRDNPFFEAWLMVQSENLQNQHLITHVYMNNLALDRDDIEGKKEQELSLSLHQAEYKHNNLAVITLPSDKGIMDYSFLIEENTLDADSFKKRIMNIVTEKNEKKDDSPEVYDCHISNSVKQILYGKIGDSYNKQAEENKLSECLNDSIKRLGFASKTQFTSAEAQALFFHFVKYEMTKFIILKLNPKTVNFTCKDGIDRGGISSLYFNLILSIEMGNPMTREEFIIALHGAPTLVKGRGMNINMEKFLNAVFCYTDNPENLAMIPDWLFKIKKEHIIAPLINIINGKYEDNIVNDLAKHLAKLLDKLIGKDNLQLTKDIIIEIDRAVKKIDALNQSLKPKNYDMQVFNDNLNLVKAELRKLTVARDFSELSFTMASPPASHNFLMKPGNRLSQSLNNVLRETSHSLKKRSSF